MQRTDKPMTQHIVILDRKDTRMQVKKTVTILYLINRFAIFFRVCSRLSIHTFSSQPRMSNVCSLNVCTQNDFAQKYKHGDRESERERLE